MANALDGIIGSLVRVAEGTAPVLPHWIQPGVKLLYESQTAGKALPAVVGDISYDKQVVILKFPHANGFKNLQFSQILGKSNPLRRNESSTARTNAAPEKATEEDGDDAERLLAAMDAKWANPALKKVARGLEQGPQLKEDWIRKLEQDKVEDLTAPAQLEAIDSSPEPERQRKETLKARSEDLENPYALGPEISAAVAAVDRAAGVPAAAPPQAASRRGRDRGASRGHSRTSSRSRKRSRGRSQKASPRGRRGRRETWRRGRSPRERSPPRRRARSASRSARRHR